MSKEARKLFSYLQKGAFFFFVYLFLGALNSRSAEAIVYYGQTYSGWNAFGYGFGDLTSLYYAYPGWIDFVIFLMIFTSLAKFAFGDRFRSEHGGGNAGKALSLAVGLGLSLGIVLWESKTGIYLLEHAAILFFVMLSVAIFWGMYALLAKKMNVSNGLAIIAALIVTYLVWLLLSSYTGLGLGNMLGYFGSGFGGFSGDGSWLRIFMMVVGLYFLLHALGGVAGNTVSHGQGGGWGNFFRTLTGGAGDIGKGLAKGTFQGIGKGFEYGAKGVGKGIEYGAKGIGAGIKSAAEGISNARKKDFLQIILRLERKSVSANTGLRYLSADVLAYRALLQNSQPPSTFTSPQRMIDSCLSYAGVLTQIAKSVVNKDTKMKYLISELNNFESIFSQFVKKIKEFDSYFPEAKQSRKNIQLVGGNIIGDIEDIRESAEILFHNFGDLSINEIRKRLNQPTSEERTGQREDATGRAQEAEGGRQQEERGHEQSLQYVIEQKQRYAGIVSQIGLQIANYRKMQDEQKRRGCFTLVQQLCQQLNNILQEVQRQGIPRGRFLSREIGNRGFQPPEYYWSLITNP